ncbi:MBL fold metallo-hydrolase [Deltaproteobacteria bacterium]|nr:MBL fold metallo-hydrolase [Deltaproteobacteria bacterium]
MAIKIYPLLTGYLNAEKSLMLTPNENYGEMVLIPSISYLIIEENRKILVDTGMPDTDYADRHRPGSYQAPEHFLGNHLARLGITPAQITDVILTHLHWDHCSNLSLFTNASFYVQRRELNYALNPHPLFYRYYNAAALGFTPPFANISFTLLDGGHHKISKSISIISTPGHTPGHQSVVLQGRDGIWVLSGDAICNEQTFTPHGHLPFLPTGPAVDIVTRYDTVNDLVGLVGGKLEQILSPHSSSALRQETYTV